MEFRFPISPRKQVVIHYEGTFAPSKIVVEYDRSSFNALSRTFHIPVPGVLITPESILAGLNEADIPRPDDYLVLPEGE